MKTRQSTEDMLRAGIENLIASRGKGDDGVGDWFVDELQKLLDETPTKVAPAPKPIVAKRHTFKKIMLDDEHYDASYLEQEGFEDRLKAFRAGQFTFVAIRAEVEILIPDVPKHRKYHSPRRDRSFIAQTITSPGLYGIDSDSSVDNMNEIFNEECNTLERMLTELGVVVED